MLAALPLSALDRPEITFKVFQFPADQIPRIDGDTADWTLVPDSYVIGMDQFVDDGRRDRVPDPKNLDVKIRVGWVKGLNRLYFLYEAYDVKARGNNGFWTLSRSRTSYGHASELCAFKLMPLEAALTPALEARWSFAVVDLDRRLVAFRDESVTTGKLTA